MKLILLFLSLNLFASEIPKLKKLNNSPVIYQSKVSTFVTSLGLHKVRVASKIKAQLFEVAEAYYKCTPSKCRLKEIKTRAFFRSCDIKASRLSCRKKLSFEEISQSDLGEKPDYGYEDVDSVKNSDIDGSSRRTRSDMESSEFPERHESNWETGDIVLF